jgi:class 3 adenylate cyclase/TolB-like protein
VNARAAPIKSDARDWHRPQGATPHFDRGEVPKLRAIAHPRQDNMSTAATHEQTAPECGADPDPVDAPAPMVHRLTETHLKLDQQASIFVMLNNVNVVGTLLAGSYQDTDGIGALQRAERAVLFVDIVESVRLIEHDEEGVVTRWLRLIDEVKSRLLPESGGRLVKSLGDGMLLEFPDIRSAVNVAFDIQKLSRFDNDPIPRGERILFRMGIEVGDIILQRDDVYGHGVNLAARLMSLAGPGEIVISANARDQLTPDLDADVEDLGDCFLRNVEQPIRAYRVGPPGAHSMIRRVVKNIKLAPVIAVLPFSPRIQTDDQGVLGEVLSEEIIRGISLAPSLSVISRLSTRAFRGRDVDIVSIGTHLNADYILSGVYSSDGSNVHVDAELAEGDTGEILWSEKFQDFVSGILAGEQELISRLIANIGKAVISRELRRAQSEPLPTLQAYSLLMGAIVLMHRLSVRDFDEAQRLLQTLIDRGNRQASPYAWLANWHVLRVQQGWSQDPHQDAYLALENTKRALDFDPDSSLALAIDGFVHTNLLRELDIAHERYELAIEINPNESLAWLLKGTLHAFKGEGEIAVSDTEHARKLTPLHPHRYFYDSLSATAHLAAHDFKGALELAEKSLRANRTHTSTLRALAIAQWQLGRHEEARRSGEELLKMEPTLTVGNWIERSPSAGYDIGTEWADVLRRIGVPQ